MFRLLQALLVEQPVPVAALTGAQVCCLSLAGGTAVSNPAGGHGCLSFVSVVCCQVEVSASGRSLVQMNPTECGIVMPWPSSRCCAMKKNIAVNP